MNIISIEIIAAGIYLIFSIWVYTDLRNKILELKAEIIKEREMRLEYEKREKSQYYEAVRYKEIAEIQTMRANQAENKLKLYLLIKKPH